MNGTDQDKMYISAPQKFTTRPSDEVLVTALERLEGLSSGQMLPPALKHRGNVAVQHRSLCALPL